MRILRKRPAEAPAVTLSDRLSFTVSSHTPSTSPSPVRDQQEHEGEHKQARGALDLDTWLATRPHTKPRPRRQGFGDATALSWAEHLGALHLSRGGSLMALTVQAPRSTSDDLRRELVVRALAALADRGDDVLAALELHDAHGHRRRLHAHGVVRTTSTISEVHRVLLDAGGTRCAVKPVTDLARWCAYCCKNVRAHNVHDRVLRAGRVRVTDGLLVRPRPLARVVRPVRLRRAEPIHGACTWCGGKLPAGRADRATCRDSCRAALSRARRGVTHRVTPPSAAVAVTVRGEGSP